MRSPDHTRRVVVTGLGVVSSVGNDKDTAWSSLVNGRLEGISVPDLLWNLCRRRSTGVLQLTARGVTKKVYVDAGRIIFATSGEPIRFNQCDQSGQQWKNNDFRKEELPADKIPANSAGLEPAWQKRLKP